MKLPLRFDSYKSRNRNDVFLKAQRNSGRRSFLSHIATATLLRHPRLQVSYACMRRGRNQLSRRDVSLRPLFPLPVTKPHFRLPLFALLTVLGSLQAFAQSVQVSGTIKTPDHRWWQSVVTLENPQDDTCTPDDYQPGGAIPLRLCSSGNLQTGRHKPGFAPIRPPSLTGSSRTEHNADLSFCTRRHKRIRHRHGGVSGTSQCRDTREPRDQGFWELHRS